MLGNWVTLFFRLLNSAVLIGLGYYIFKKYIKSRIDEKINQREILVKGLEEQGYFLEGKLHNLEEHFVLQARKIKSLKEKVDEWNTQVEGFSLQKQEEYKQNREHAQQQAIRKSQNRADQQRQEYITHTIVEKSRALLEQEFTHSHCNQRYVQDIIKHVERKCV